MARMMSRVGFAEHATVGISETVDAMYINTTAYLTQSRCGRVVVLSYREPPNGPAFWTERAEAAAFVGPRLNDVKEIDGFTVDQLRAKAFEGLVALQARRAKEQTPVSA